MARVYIPQPSEQVRPSRIHPLRSTKMTDTIIAYVFSMHIFCEYDAHYVDTVTG